MAFASGSKGGAVAAINVTPLVDVVLVLLIIFMVITPMLQRGKEVQLPESKHADDKKNEADPVMLSITADKKLWVEQDEVELSALEATLRDKLSEDATKPIMIKGDSALTVGDVRRVFKSAQNAGSKGVGLAVEQQKQ